MNTLVAPVMALVAWSLVIWVWMYVQRLPAMSRAGIEPQAAAFPGGLDGLPTIFYAAALAIQVAGHGDALAVGLAWAFVASRVLHSLIQVSVNIVLLRFLAFSAGTLVLAWMVARELAKLFAG